MPATNTQPVPGAVEIYDALCKVNAIEADIRRLRQRISTAPQTQVTQDPLKAELDGLKASHRNALMRWSKAVRVEADHAEAAAKEALAEIVPRCIEAENEWRAKQSKSTSDTARALANQNADVIAQIGAASARRTAAQERVQDAARYWWSAG
jgi:hypothetical protein